MVKIKVDDCFPDVTFFQLVDGNPKTIKTSDIFNEKKQGVFQHFEWIDPINNIVCNLLSNKFIIEKNQNKLNKNVLFKLPERNELYLFNEFKRFDLLFRSSNEKIIKSIKYLLIEEPMISLVYSIPEEKIRNQLNLIFQ